MNVNDLSTKQIRLVLLNNLLKRIDCNDKSGAYTLNGRLTYDEYQALQGAVLVYKAYAEGGLK